MQSSAIQRQYDEVIAQHYDADPQSVKGDSLERALAQLIEIGFLAADLPPLAALDVGLGTGVFYEKLRKRSGRQIVPHGLDFSAKMVEIARSKLPDLTARVDDASHLDSHFRDRSFDLVCTHFVTSFVPMSHLAPTIRDKLEPGGFWSFVGGTQEGFPNLHRKANSRPLRWLFGGKGVNVARTVCNPADRNDVVRILQGNGFTVRLQEVFEPRVRFRDFEDFMEFAYRGGWLTPFIEELGVHKLGKHSQRILNKLVFPAADSHTIVITLAQKTG